MFGVRPALSRRIWRMAGPIVVSNVSVPLIGAVDTAVMGHLDAAYYIGAVAIGAMIFNFLFHLLNCLRMGTTGPTARARGREDWGEVRAMLWRALTLAGGAAALIVLLQGPIAALAFGLVEASAEVEEHARTYFFIRVWTAPANLAIFAIIGWCYGLEDSRTPLVLQIVVNVTNMALDIVFVMGFGWGVEGVAVATLIGEYLGLAVAVLAVRRRLKRLPPGRVRRYSTGRGCCAWSRSTATSPSGRSASSPPMRSSSPRARQRATRHSPPTRYWRISSSSPPSAWTGWPMQARRWSATLSGGATAPGCTR